MPEGDTLARIAVALRPYLAGRVVTGARARLPGPQVSLIVGQKIDAVDAAGKNLLIKFDGGLELRTHLGLHGSWHRYRPGETWRRPPSRAALVIEVPGAVAVCFDAPGHGVSPGTQATMREYADATLAVLQRFPSITTIVKSVSAKQRPRRPRK